uniref:Uncharacterized protein n=1 Tax=Oryza sativa subsp. japonica TaxID=39947 RepID=Q6Z6A6_ORYSJ|nr:hypothetical protein [Oryza sativa Japonica Group]BAD17231.1 hypothetical protein [Oryza sativa Japonica Group]
MAREKTKKKKKKKHCARQFGKEQEGAAVADPRRDVTPRRAPETGRATATSRSPPRAARIRHVSVVTFQRFRDRACP